MLQKTWADGAYQGQQVEKVTSEGGITLEVVKRSDKDRGIVAQAESGIVERTFGWLNRERRLSMDSSARRSPPNPSFIWA